MVADGDELRDGVAGAILTPELAASVGVSLGGTLALLTNDRDGVLNAVDVAYVGRYGQPGLPLPDKKLGFVPLALAQELLRMPGQATELVVATRRLDDAAAVAARLQAALGAEYEVSTWHDVAAFVDEAIAAQNLILRLVAAVFVFVALLGIANTMLMSVLERTREIGTMMSLGVRRRLILRLFLVEAMLIGLGGGLAGSAAGAAIVHHYHASGVALRLPEMVAPLHIYPTVGFGYLVFVVALGVGGALLAALWPSLRASRMSPVAALAAV
jgi:putative ABC transport system permease protein